MSAYSVKFEVEVDDESIVTPEQAAQAACLRVTNGEHQHFRVLDHETGEEEIVDLDDNDDA